MMIIGCDYHPSFQYIAFVDSETGECGERKLTHKQEAESFYRGLNGGRVRIGMEATGHARWFERLLAELNYELWIGDQIGEHTSELQSPCNLVCRLLLEKKKKNTDERVIRLH